MIKLDIGCGGKKQEGFTGIDYRPLEGVDIVHDLELVPWPLDADSVITAIASHVVEHIKPWLTITFMNEVWRVLTAGGTFAVATPYAGSPGYWQDPSHCNGWNEATFQYFDPRYPLYWIYQPSPWKIVKGFPVWQSNGNLECIMEKVLDAKKLVDDEYTLSVSVEESVKTKEVLR